MPTKKKTTAKKPAARKPAAKTAKPTQRESALHEAVWDLDAVYDGEDVDSPGEIAEIFENAFSHAKTKVADVTRDELLPFVAKFRGIEQDELRRILDEVGGQNKRAARAVATAKKGGPVDVAALEALLRRHGPHGERLDTAAAKTFSRVWDQIAGETLGDLFATETDLWLTNLEPVHTLAGLERATLLETLKIRVASDCDLSPLTKLTKLTTLDLRGHHDDLAALAKTNLRLLTVETGANGLAQLAKTTSLNMLTLVLAPGVPLAGLLALPTLMSLELITGERPLDADVLETMTTLATKNRKVHLLLGDKWPVELAAKGIGTNIGWRVEIN